MSQRRQILFALGLALGTLAAAGGEPTISKEHQIKAAFLYNFTKFVEWPQSRLADDEAPIVIGILGRNPFGDVLANLVRDRKVNRHPIVITQLRSVAEVATVHVVFVAAGEESLLRPEGYAWPEGVLGVGESERFAKLGAVIFTVVDDKVRFEINQAAAEQARLKLSAQLLKLATVVRRKT